METAAKEKRKIITLSMTDEYDQLMTKLAEAVGVSRSELVRRMLRKFSLDEKGRAILRHGIMGSHNALYENEKNAAAEPRNDGEPSSLDSTNNLLENPETININEEDIKKEWLKYSSSDFYETKKIGYEAFRQKYVDWYQAQIREAIETVKARWVD